MAGASAGVFGAASAMPVRILIFVDFEIQTVSNIQTVSAGDVMGFSGAASFGRVAGAGVLEVPWGAELGCRRLLRHVSSSVCAFIFVGFFSV